MQLSLHSCGVLYAHVTSAGNVGAGAAALVAAIRVAKATTAVVTAAFDQDDVRCIAT